MHYPARQPQSPNQCKHVAQLTFSSASTSIMGRGRAMMLRMRYLALQAVHASHSPTAVLPTQQRRPGPLLLLRWKMILPCP